MWGLLLIALCGFLALSLDAARWHPWLAIPFGIGLALVLDEFALLLQLKDVYWAQQGRISVDIGILVAAALLLYYLGQCFWHDVAAELRRWPRARPGWRARRGAGLSREAMQRRQQAVIGSNRTVRWGFRSGRTIGA